MAKQDSQGERSPDQKAADKAREQPSPDKGTEEGLPIDMRPQAGQETSSAEEGGEDLASLLASFQEQEGEGDQKSDRAETEEDRELSRMISLMTSRDPGLARPGEAGEETSGGEAPETLPEGAEVILDAESSPETSATEEGAPAETGADASDAAETELASVAGDERLEDEATPDGVDASEQEPTPTAKGDETIEAEAIEGYDVTDTVDALLSTIGLEDEQEGASFAPPIPEGGIRDDGTPVEDLVDDRILEDFRELHRDLHAPSVAGGIPVVSLPGGLAEGHARILCIDDDPDNRSLFKGILDVKDYTFVDAESGEEALEILREGEVDLVLLNLDIASQDGFELIEEAASDVALSQVPILVNSALAEHIEKALRLGASDYFIRPMNVIDVKFQIPIKAKNLLKIRRAERMLSLAGGPHDVDAVAGPPMGEGPETETQDLPAPGDETLSDLLNAGEDEVLTASEETAGVSAGALEDLLKGDEEEAGESEEDPATVLTENAEDVFKDEEKDEEEGVAAEEAEEDLASVLAEDEENLFGEDEQEAGESEEDLAAALTENAEDVFEDEEKDGEPGDTEEDLATPLATEEENLDKLFDEEDASERPAETDKTPDNLKEIAGLGVVGAAVVAVGAAAMRSEPDHEETRSAADILTQSPGRGPSPIWRSPNMARSRRERILQERRVEMPRRSGRRRLLYAVFALLLVGVSIWALWAKQRLRETGELTSVFPAPPKFQALKGEKKAAESSPATSEFETSSEGASSSSSSSRESGGYERARERVSVPSREAGQLASEKAHLRATVEQVAAAGGQWWAPWQVIRESGESIKELVDERRRDDILEVFGVSEEKVERGLRRKSVVDFLEKKGFKIQGKQASDLSAREMFEVLSMREIQTKDKIVAILSALKDKATAARAERAARLKATQPSHLALRPEPLKVDLPARAMAAWEQSVSHQRSAKMGETANNKTSETSNVKRQT